jgi:hypothetical protein
VDWLLVLLAVALFLVAVAGWVWLGARWSAC